MNLEIPKEMIDEGAHHHLNTELLNGKLILGMMGYSRSGKDTLARVFVDSQSYQRIAFGDSLKEEMNKHLKEVVAADLKSKYIDIPFEKINFLEEKDKMVKEILRPYMIWFGEELRRINGKYYWMHKAFEKIKSDKGIFVTILNLGNIRRVDELDIFRGNMFSKSRQVTNLIYAGHLNTEEVVSFEEKYDSVLFHINQYKLEEKDELTVKAIQRAHEDWLFADTIHIDSRIEEEKRDGYIKTIAHIMKTKYNL